MERHWRRRVVGVILATSLMALSLPPPPVQALSCAQLADHMFSSKRHAVGWAKRYYKAGCGD